MVRNTNFDSQRTQLSRRRLIRDGALIASGLAVGLREPLHASWISSGKALLLRAGRFGIRGMGGLGGLVLTEGILGILRAYDIDVSRWVEDIVRDLSGKERAGRVAVAPIRPYHGPRARDRDAPKAELQISAGTCPSGSEIAVLYDGYNIRIRQHGNPVWSMGLVFWGATRHLPVKVRCLSSVDCGHPVSHWKSRDVFNRNYRYLEQQFEGGLVRLVIDLHLPKTIERVFSRNQNVDVWLPSKG